MKVEAKQLQQEILFLKAAIEDAILNTQKSLRITDEGLATRPVSDRDLSATTTERDRRAIGWLEDF